MDISKCAGCPLDGISSPCEPAGDVDAPFMVVTDTPTKFAAKSGHLLSSGPLGVLSNGLTKQGFKKQDFQFVAQIRCPHDADTYSTKEKKLIQKTCREHLLDDFDECRPEVIIPLGAEPSKQVMGRAVKITKAHGVGEYSDEHMAMVLPFLNPGMVVMYPQHAPAFASDCATLRRLVDNDYDQAAASSSLFGDYQFIDDLEFLIEQEPELIFFDTENTSLEYFLEGPDDVRSYDPTIHDKTFSPSAAILTMQFCIKPGEAYMLVWDHPERPIPMRRKAKIKDQLKRLLCRKGVTVVGQNIKYDNNYLYHQTGIRFRVGGDTLMLAAILDENMISKGQDATVKRYVPEMAGYADCVHPDTLLLLEDLTKRKASDIREGDRLVGFEEEATGGNSRKMVETVVESVRTLRMASVVVTMDTGERIQVSTNHQFLRGPKKENSGGSWVWRSAASLCIGDKLKLFPFPEYAESRDAGWMAGVLDGEGYACTHGSCGLRLGFCQLDGAVLRKGVELFNLGENQISWDKRKSLANVTVTGAKAMSELIRLRPVRLVNKKPWIGKALFVGEGTYSRVRSIEYVGTQEVVSIQTSSRTFVAEGFATHNCFNATTDKSRMWEVPLDKMLNYGCGDVDSGLRLFHVLYEELCQDTKLKEHYRRVSLPGLNTFAAVEYLGIRIDDRALDDFEAVMEETVKAQYETLIAQVPKSIKRLHIDKGLKFSRSDFTLDILFRHKDGFRLKPKVFTKTTAKLPPEKRVPSTSSKDHLPYFYDDCPFTMQLSQYVKDERLLGTSVKGFRKKYIHNGLVRPIYSLWTTVTGRSSSENPNGQNFPKRGKNATAYRRIFIPPPGYYVLEADLSQAELRISADMAGDRTMLEIYRNKGDIHTATALIVMQITMEDFKKLPKAEQKSARSKAKAVNFGFIYGMGWRKFIGYAKTQYGVEFTELEAQRIRTQFFEKYHALPDWHEAMRQFARRNKFVRSYSGRVRHLPMIDSEDEMVQAEAGRQAINSPVQEFGSSLGIMAIGRLHEEIDPKYLAPIAFVHDAIYCYVPKKYVEWGAKTLKWYMESNDISEWFGIKMKAPIIADVSFGENFGDTHEMAGLNLDDDFDFDALWEDDDGRLEVPKQYYPPNNGMRTCSPYTEA